MKSRRELSHSLSVIRKPGKKLEKNQINPFLSHNLPHSEITHSSSFGVIFIPETLNIRLYRLAVSRIKSIIYSILQ